MRAEPTLKDPADFRLIGTDVPKLDTKARTTGEAVFTMDVMRDGMKVPPTFGATGARVNTEPALTVPGVQRVQQVPWHPSSPCARREPSRSGMFRKGAAPCPTADASRA